MQTETIEDYYRLKACDHKVYGPVDLSTLLEWARDQRVQPDTLIYCQSDNSWRRAETIPRVREMLWEVGTAKDAPTDVQNAPEEISPEELRQFPRLAQLTDTQLEQVRRFGELRVARYGTCIIRKGDPGDALYLVLTGEVRVRLILGSEDKTLFTIGPGEFFGEMALFNDAPRSADVVAVVESRLMRVTQPAFTLFVEELPEIASPILYNLAKTLADRLSASNIRCQQDSAAQFLWR